MRNIVVPVKKEQLSQPNRRKNLLKLILSVVLVLVVVLVVAGASYAVFTQVLTGTKTHSVVAGTFAIEFEEGQTIALTNTAPLSDSEGQALTPYIFTIRNTGTVDASYRIRFEEDQSNPSKSLARDKIKMSVKKGSAAVSTPALLSTYPQEVLLANNEVLASGQDITYEVRMWVDESAGNEVQGKSYKAKVVVEAVQKVDATYQDTIAPVITLAGQDSISIAQNTTYTDAGVSSVVDDVDGNIASSFVQVSYEYYNPATNATTSVSKVDTTKLGIYYVYYRINDSAGNEGVRVRSVNVNRVDATPPTITLSGDTLLEVSKGTNYIEPGYTATDTLEGNLTDRVVVIGVVNKDVVGSYVIKYLVTDQSGNAFSITRTINVIEGTSPSCFVFNSGVISDYNCKAGNSLGLPTITDVEIPSAIGGVAVTTIGNIAFQGASLTSVVIPEGVTTIEQTAFMFNQLTSLELPDSVTTIGSTAFAYNQLTSLKLSNKLVTIEDSAFVSNKLTTVVLPETLKSIGINAFATNQLTGTITVPASVTTIADGVFAISSGSNSKLTKVINKTGRAFDWGKILMAHSDSIEIPPQNCITGTITNKAGYTVVVSAS